MNYETFLKIGKVSIKQDNVLKSVERCSSFFFKKKNKKYYNYLIFELD